MLSRDRDDLVERGLLPDRATADIGGLLDADDRLRRLVAGARVERLAKRFRRELAVGALQLGDLEAADRGMRAALTRDDMRALVREDLIARTAMHQRRGDIAHRAGRHVDRSF